MEYCEMVENKKTKVGCYSGNGAVLCPIEKCPYDNGMKINWELEETTICLTSGFVEKSGLIKNLECLKIA